MTGKAFIDARCPKCDARIGWFGTVLDHPGCCRCGWKPSHESLQADHDEMVGFAELLAELRSANPGWDKWRKARVAAGLTLRNAAKLLGILPSELSAIERGQTTPSQSLTGFMVECYGAKP